MNVFGYSMVLGLFAVAGASADTVFPISGSSTGSVTSTATGVTTYTATGYAGIKWGNGSKIAHLYTGTGTYSFSQDYASLGGENIRLASVLWDNTDQTHSVFSAQWEVQLSFVAPPSGPTPIKVPDALSLTLSSGNSGPDTITLDDLSGKVLALTGYTASNFRYAVDDGNGTLDGSKWTTPEGSRDKKLWLVADFTQNTPDASTVPEPSSILLLGSIASVLVWAARRKYFADQQR